VEVGSLLRGQPLPEPGEVFYGGMLSDDCKTVAEIARLADLYERQPHVAAREPGGDDEARPSEGERAASPAAGAGEKELTGPGEDGQGDADEEGQMTGDEETRTPILHLIVKGPQAGSLEAIASLVESTSTLPATRPDGTAGRARVSLNLVHGSTGRLTDRDLFFAKSSDGVIVLYNTVEPSDTMLRRAADQGIPVFQIGPFDEMVDVLGRHVQKRFGRHLRFVDSEESE
jgi:translation initiation factor IF-2